MAVKEASSKKQVASKTAALPKEVFAVDVANHELLKRAYEAYLANGRENLAVVKTRGLVRGGGRKPWRQKGTGKARAGSIRSPIWRGGGITFGPTGSENYTKTLPTAQKRQAIRQALSLANRAKKISQLEFKVKDGKTSEVVAFLDKNNLERRTLIVVDNKEELMTRASRNIQNLKLVQATYLNVFDIVNADNIVITNKALEAIVQWLSPTPITKTKAVETSAKKPGGSK